MTVYSVGCDTFYNLKSAKAKMKETGLKGFKQKIYNNGDWVNCGEISLTKSNKCNIVGSRNCKSY